MFRKRERHPVARTRAVLAGADLFFPGKHQSTRRRRARKFLKRTRSSPGITRWLEKKGYLGQVGTRFLPGKYYLVNTLRENKAVVLHEMAHFYDVGKNDLVTANAITGYFWRMAGKCSPDYNPTKFYYLRVLAYVKQVLKFGKSLGYGSLEHPGKTPGIAPEARNLGAFAADKEREWQKPASGLFLIMEICNGTPIRKAIRKIESGELDSEINAFAKKHFKNLLS